MSRADGFYEGAEWVRTQRASNTSTTAKRLRIDRVAGDRVHFTVIEAGGKPVGTTLNFGKNTIQEHYTHVPKETPMNNTINIGDRFVGDRARTFRELVVTAPATSDYSRERKWRCIGTRHNGTTTPTTLFESTLLSRYTRKSTRDFNVNTESYQRPMSGGVPALDVPAVPTPLIRDTVTVPRFIGDTTSTLLHFAADGNVRQAKGKDAKVQLLIQATDGYMVLAVPGKYSMDVFFVDSRESALEALGLRRGTPVKTVTDALGNTWVAA